MTRPTGFSTTVSSSAGLGAPREALPPYSLDQLGDSTFRTDHRVRFNYYAGAMANGIASVELVEALSRAGLLAFFGAAGLGLARVQQALTRLQHSLGTKPFGVNLIHSPNEPKLESGNVELFLKQQLRLVEASAYLDLTLPVVQYRLQGIQRGPDGSVLAPNRVIAKVSRVEVASKFMSPAPAGLVQQLVRAGQLTAEQAELALRVPMAQDITAEADSAGHTDNRPALTLLPSLLALRNRLQAQYQYAQPLRVGAAGGISTPAAVAAVLTMGAAYFVTGSVNQACVESGSSPLVRQMLAEAEQADTIMAPAADMFEMGVKVQVLKRGTLFAMRAGKLYELYRNYSRLEDIPAADKAMLEKTIFRASCDEIWSQTQTFFHDRDPAQLARAETDPKHKLALLFRWYLGLSSRWANTGEPSRKVDYQVWCGPAMGAFNEWTKGTFLERPEERRVVTVALNLLAGAAQIMQATSLRCQGVPYSEEMMQPRPRPLAELEACLHGGNS